jgi:hypothetical protein
MNNWKSKYLKYKAKYLALKNIQRGGMGNEILKKYLTTTELGGKPDALFSLDEYQQLVEKCNDCTMGFSQEEFKEHIVMNGIELSASGSICMMSIDFNNGMENTLVVFAGMSKKSTLNTMRVLVKKLSTIKQKFKSLYVFEYSMYSNWQTTACQRLRDGDFKNDEEKKFLPELEMNKNIAMKVHDIINNLHLTNVHLLGKCNGGWVALELFLLGGYKGLYLAVPGIPPIDRLKLLRPYKNSAKFLFRWNKQDKFKFVGWNTESYQEEERYKSEMDKIGINGVTGHYDDGKPGNEKDYHEVNELMIDEL